MLDFLFYGWYIVGMQKNTATYVKKDTLSDYIAIQKALNMPKTDNEAIDDLLAIDWVRREKYKKLRSSFRCPDDGSPLVDVRGGMKCKKCKAVYTGMNFLSAELIDEFNIIDTQNVSAHSAVDLIEPFKTLMNENPDHLLLDCGCGYKTKEYIEANPRVINFEIVDYASTDVLGVGEKLPFADNTFEYIISSSVLEHVMDPFKCADEMRRVLKPGGKIMCSVPFLIPFHGYPHHYYNMTSQGLANLFKGMKIESNSPSSPIFALTSLVGLWAMGLGLSDRIAFDKVTLGELASAMPALHSGQPSEWPNKPWVANLTEDARRILAWGNTIIATK